LMRSINREVRVYPVETEEQFNAIAE